jgi:succinoglycan biosynthesis protein ExoV
MPHWQSAPDEWERVCATAGIGFIDPRWPTARVLEALRRTDVLLTEAMHGAIVADALRVPWIAIRTRSAIKAFKWEDWCQSMGLEYRPQALPPVWPTPDSAGILRRARRWGRLKMIATRLARIGARERPMLSGAETLRTRLDALETRLERLRWNEIVVPPRALDSRR